MFVAKLMLKSLAHITDFILKEAVPKLNARAAQAQLATPLLAAAYPSFTRPTLLPRPQPWYTPVPGYPMFGVAPSAPSYNNPSRNQPPKIRKKATCKLCGKPMEGHPKNRCPED